jgi:hypothetical protein
LRAITDGANRRRIHFERCMVDAPVLRKSTAHR